MKATNVIGSTATVREKCIDRIMPYTFFPTIFLQVPMCYEEFLIQPVRQFDKSINHTFSLQSINKSIRHRVEHYLEHAPLIVTFEFFFVLFFCFVFFVFALFVLVGWVVSFCVVLFCFFVCLFHLSAESSTTLPFFFFFFFFL